MSFMHMGTIAAASVGGAEINISGGNVFASGFKFATAGFQWQPDGNVFSTSSSTGTNQIYASSDWIRPTDDPGVAAEDYFIRIHTVQDFGFGLCEQTSGSMTESFNGGPVTWYSLGVSTRYANWDVADSFGENECDVSYIAEIRYLDGSNTSINNIISTLDGLAIIDSGSYNIFLVTT